MPQLQLILAVGSYAQRWHLGPVAAAGMTAAVSSWRELLQSASQPRRLALPHPSWRNNAWLAANPPRAFTVVTIGQKELKVPQ